MATPVPEIETGEMNFKLTELQKPLYLKQVCRDPTWDFAKTIGFIIASILFIYTLGNEMYWLGARSGQPTPAPPAVAAQSVTPVAPTTTPSSQPRWSSYADCQRAYVLTLRRDPEGACDNLK